MLHSNTSTHCSIADPNVLLECRTLALFIRVDEVLSNRSTCDDCFFVSSTDVHASCGVFYAYTGWNDIRSLYIFFFIKDINSLKS
jgi:hypothetical protein